MNLHEVSLVNVFHNKLKHLKSVLCISAYTFLLRPSLKAQTNYIHIDFSISQNPAQNKQLILSIDHDSCTLNFFELTTLDQLWSRVGLRCATYPIGGVDIIHHTESLILQLIKLSEDIAVHSQLNGSQYNCQAKLLIESYNFSKIEWPSAAQ